MALQFILGSSGAGKSYQLYQQVIRRSKSEPDRNFLVLVPEQFTMQTQRDLVGLHPDLGITNIDVLSFMRLAYRVFEETGGGRQGMASMPVLEDTGKNMVLRKLLENMGSRLTVFGSAGRKQGFVAELKSLLSEVYQYSVSPERLKEAVDRLDKKPLLQRKLQDTLTLYQAFQDYKKDKYITAEEILDILCGVILEQTESGKEIRLLKNSVVCLDGYTGFTPSQYQLLRILMRTAGEMVVTVTIDAKVDIFRKTEEFFLFHLSQKTIQKLTDIAKEEGVEAADPFYPALLPGLIPYRFRDSRALAALERGLFRYREVPFTGEQEDIGICIQQNPAAETAWVLGEVGRLLREENCRYRDIAVITGDMDTYGGLFDYAFEQAGIPHFIDYKKDIMKNPLVEFTLASLAVLEENFSYESVFRYLRSGLSGFDTGDVDVLENYVLAYGIRGKSAYAKIWERPASFRRKVTAEEEEAGRMRLEQMNRLRSDLVARFEPLGGAWKESVHTVEDVTRALYLFLTVHKAEEQIEEYRLQFRDAGLTLLEKEYAQVYRLVMELFDKLVVLLGEEVLTIEDYRKVMQSGFEEQKVGLIPPGLDQIVVGDTARTRLKDIRALFFVGVNDGIVPSGAAAGGILTDLDRGVLEAMEIELAPTAKSRAYTEQYYLYLNLTKPSHRLYLTYSRSGMDGKTMRPSYLLAKLHRLFPSLIERDGEKEALDVRTELRKDGGLQYLLSGLQSPEPGRMPQEFRDLFRYYTQIRQGDGGGIENADVAAMLKGYTSKPIEGRLQKPVAGVLYGELSGSVTRLERYAACAFSHFLTYGLELQERRTYQIAVPDLGNIFHYALECYSRKLKENGCRWVEIPEELRTEYVRQSVEEATWDYGGGVLHSTKRNEAVIHRVQRMTERTVWAIGEQLKSGEFEPGAFEVQFSFEALHGRIDRIDTCEADGVEYVKIVDYKSGNKSFNLSDFYYGLGLQLVVYLSAAEEEERRKNPGKLIIPAGIFYYHINDPLIEKPPVPRRDASGEEDIDSLETIIEEQRLEELKPSGLVQGDKKILRLLDKTMVDSGGSPVPGRKSTVIPVAFDKEGMPNSYSSVATQAQMEALMSHVNRKMKTFSAEILEGEAAVNPYRKGGDTACDFCGYQSICGFSNRESNTYRLLPELPKDILWSKICGEPPSST